MDDPTSVPATEPTQANNPEPTTQAAVDSAPAPQEPTVDPVPDALGGAATQAQEQAPQVPQVPEAYEPFVDAEGKPYDAELVKEFSEVARELGLSQENAQKAFGSMVPAARSFLQKDLVRQATQWSEDAARDPEIGGESFKANLGVAASAYNEYATPELKQIISSSGLGNHPEIIRLFYRVGKAMQQDKGVTGGASAPATKTRRFPNSDMVVD